MKRNVLIELVMYAIAFNHLVSTRIGRTIGVPC